mgnify:CR=1 FL=1
MLVSINFLCMSLFCIFVTMAVRPQYSKVQRSFMVRTYNRTGNVKETINLFTQRFPGARRPCYNTVVRNDTKYEAEGTSHNLNKGRSGRRRWQITAANVAHVQNVFNVSLT